MILLLGTHELRHDVVDNHRRRLSGGSKDYFSRLYIIVHCYWVIGAPNHRFLIFGFIVCDLIVARSR